MSTDRLEFPEFPISIISIKHHISCAHRLLNHPGKCRTLHGHNYILDIQFAKYSYDLRNGMVVDFGDVKKKLIYKLDEMYDHRTILQNTDPLLVPLQADATCHAGPVVMFSPPTVENLARDIFCELNKWMKDIMNDDKLRLYRVTMEETPGCSATYPM